MSSWDLFLSSISFSFNMLLQWQTWLVLFANVAINFGVFLLIVFVAKPKGENEEEGAKAQNVTYFMLGFLQAGIRALVLGLSIAYLLPIMFGHIGGLSLTTEQFLPSLFPSIFSATIVVWICCCLPIVGRIINDNSGLQAFIQSALICNDLLGPPIKSLLRNPDTAKTVFPEVWPCLGYGLISMVLAFGIFALVYLIEFAIRRKSGLPENEKFVPLGGIAIAPSLGVIAGLVSLFMYAGYINSALLPIAKSESDRNAQIVKLAEDGNSIAQSQLGFMYASGVGFAEDAKKGKDWLEKAAAHGDRHALFNLGILSESKNDYAEAASFFEKVVANGVENDLVKSEAEYMLGQLYFSGAGVKQDFAKSVDLHKMAASNGNTRAMYALGLMYELGNSHSEEAALYLKKATKDGVNRKNFNMLHLLAPKKEVEALLRSSKPQ